METLQALFTLAMIGSVFLFLALAGWLWRTLVTTARVMHHQAARRTVDAVFVWAGWRALGKPRPGQDTRPPPPRTPLTGDDVYAACPMSAWTGDPDTCRWCDRPLPAGSSRWCGPACRHTGENNHVWSAARDQALRLAGYRCRACSTTTDPEVNHITPVLGRHAEVGCHHHQANLEVLCGPASPAHCHQQATNAQRRAGHFGAGARGRRRRRSNA